MASWQDVEAQLDEGREVGLLQAPIGSPQIPAGAAAPKLPPARLPAWNWATAPERDLYATSAWAGFSGLLVSDRKDGERGRNRTYNLLIKSQQSRSGQSISKLVSNQ